MKLSVFLGTFGLALDILGAYYLARSFISKTVEDISNETATMCGYNSHVVNSLAQQKAEAQIGFAVMATGFIGQLVAYCIPIVQISRWFVVAYVIVPFLPFFILNRVILRLKSVYVEEYKNYTNNKGTQKC